MRWILIAVFLLLGACTRMRFIIDTGPIEEELTETVVIDQSGYPPGKIAMIDVSGVITDARSRGILRATENPVGRFIESLEKARRDERVDAIIVRINSPGGGVTASDIMYRELQYFKEESGKPVVILMGDLAASGGYYLACAGDRIIAHPTTITGSIGVIIQTINVADGMQRIGIRADSITSGPNKAMGSPFETMSAEHRALLQEIVNEFYAGFVEIVKTNRPGLSESDLKWITDGRVITGKRAAEVGVVDQLGDLRDALEVAKELADIDTAKLVKYHRPVDYVGSAYSNTPMQPTQANLLQLNVNIGGLPDSTGIYYLWDPTAW